MNGAREHLFASGRKVLRGLGFHLARYLPKP
jgi:hypothetical protein